MSMHRSQGSLRPFSASGYEIFDEDFGETGEVVIWSRSLQHRDLRRPARDGGRRDPDLHRRLDGDLPHAGPIAPPERSGRRSALLLPARRV